MNDKREKKITPSYEDDIEELTSLVDEIGKDDLPVDLLEGKVKRAAELIRSLRERLSATETAVKEVLEDLKE